MYPGDAKQYFRDVNRKITEVLEADKCALVHCYGSISRSAVLIIAYLMESKGIDLLDATQLMKNKWDATWYVHLSPLRNYDRSFKHVS